MTKPWTVPSLLVVGWSVLVANPARATILTSFEVPAEGATSFVAAGGEIGWRRTTTGTGPHPQVGVRARANITGEPFVPAINATPPDGGKVYLSRGISTGGSNGLGEVLTFDTVPVTAGEALQLKYFASVTSWEVAEFLRVTLNLSDNTTATLLDIVGGAIPNQIDAVEGVWRTLTYPVPAGITSAQLVIRTFSNSSLGDEGFAFDQYERTIASPPPNPPSLFRFGITNFESDPVAARERVAEGFPNATDLEPLAFRGTFTAAASGVSGVADYPTNGGHQLQLNNGRWGNGDATTGTTPFQFDPQDVTGWPAVSVSFDLRTEGRTSGFEDTDELHMFVEGTSDGVNYAPIGTIVDFVGLLGSDNDALDMLDSDGVNDSDVASGAWTHFSQSFDTTGLTRIRLVIDADVDSVNEFIMLDNVRITAVPEPATIVLVALAAVGLGLARPSSRLKKSTGAYRYIPRWAPRWSCSDCRRWMRSTVCLRSPAAM